MTLYNGKSKFSLSDDRYSWQTSIHNHILTIHKHCIILITVYYTKPGHFLKLLLQRNMYKDKETQNLNGFLIVSRILVMTHLSRDRGFWRSSIHILTICIEHLKPCNTFAIIIIMQYWVMRTFIILLSNTRFYMIKYHIHVIK